MYLCHACTVWVGLQSMDISLCGKLSIFFSFVKFFFIADTEREREKKARKGTEAYLTHVQYAIVCTGGERYMGEKRDRGKEEMRDGQNHAHTRGSTSSTQVFTQFCLLRYLINVFVAFYSLDAHVNGPRTLFRENGRESSWVRSETIDHSRRIDAGWHKLGKHYRGETP